MKKYTMIIALFILLFIFVLPLDLYSLVVDWIAGEVTYSHYRGEWQALEIGRTLVSGDIIKTGMNSETILTENGSEVHILENSSFTVSEKYEADRKRSSFLLFLGRMRFKLGVGKEEPEIATQTVNLAIRGTEFEVGSGYDGSTIVLIQDGVVSVQGKTRQLLIKAGEGTEVGFGEEPSEKFSVMTKVIDWDKWFASSQEAVKGNESNLLTRILEKFRDIDAQIRDYEQLRERSLKEKEEYLKSRDKLIGEGKTDEAAEYSRMAGDKSKTAYHSIVNIRFLALSSIGLFDMAERIYIGVEQPTKELTSLFESIQKIYVKIDEKYIMEGDRERLEEKAGRKKGCLKLF